MLARGSDRRARVGPEQLVSVVAASPERSSVSVFVSFTSIQAQLHYTKSGLLLPSCMTGNEDMVFSTGEGTDESRTLSASVGQTAEPKIDGSVRWRRVGMAG